MQVHHSCHRYEIKHNVFHGNMYGKLRERNYRCLKRQIKQAWSAFLFLICRLSQEIFLCMASNLGRCPGAHKPLWNSFPITLPQLRQTSKKHSVLFLCPWPPWRKKKACQFLLIKDKIDTIFSFLKNIGNFPRIQKSFWDQTWWGKTISNQFQSQ